jgi:flavodoxin
MPNSKNLIIYYSLEGNTKFIAETMAKISGADLLELKPEKEISSKNFMKFFWGGKQVMMKEKPKLLPLDKNPNDYDLIIIGTPVWVLNYAPPLRTFFNDYKILNKKVALFCTHEGNPGKTLTNMANEQFNNQIIGQIDFLKPLKNKGGSLTKVENWVKQIIS